MKNFLSHLGGWTLTDAVVLLIVVVVVLMIVREMRGR